MIYTKQSNFPYPLLRSESEDYVDGQFEFDVLLEETNTDYIITVIATISSSFIKDLIDRNKARLVLVIKSKDNQFHVLDNSEETKVKINKTKLSFNSKTIMQLMIQSLDDIYFKLNEDLSEFYKEFKNDIKVNKGLALGFSNTVVLDSSEKKPFDLFEKRIDPNMIEDIKVEIGREVIIIVYNSESLMFNDVADNRNLSNPYLYIGLQKALVAWFLKFSIDREQSVDIDELCLNDMLTPLDSKLLELMKAKGIEELDLDEIDSIIQIISEDILKKYVKRVRRALDGD